MAPSLRRRLRPARRGLWYVAAISLVAMALAAGVVSQLLPLAERHPDRIAEWLSARAGRPVAFDGLQTAWTRRGPLLRLQGLRIGEGRNAIPIGEAEVLVSQYAGLLPGRSFTELRLRGLELTLVRAEDGRWAVRGLPGQQTGGDPLAALEGLGELQLVDARLGIDAPSLGLSARVPDIDLRLQVDAGRLRAGAQARMRPMDTPLRASFVLDRASGDGRLYAVANDAALGGWSELLQAFGVTVLSGHGDAQVWATLANRQVRAVTADVDLNAVRLQGAALEAGEQVGLPRAEFAALQARLFWQAENAGWRLDAERLRVQVAEGETTQRLDGLLLAGGQRYGLRAERVDAAPLIAVAALSDRLPAGLRRWLVASHPQAVLEQIEIAGEAAAGRAAPLQGGGVDASAGLSEASSAGPLQVSATLRDVGFASVGNAPGVRGLGGRLAGDGRSFVFAFDPESRTDFDWPTGFGAAHPLHLRGEAVVWRDGAGWRVETPALRIDGEGYGADARGGLWFEGDGSRPSIDMAVDLDDARAVQAERFWPKFAMSQSLIDWLDTAVDTGWVRDGRAVIRGDLDDWPFTSHGGAVPAGVFDARATLDDMRVKFHSDWPEATRLSGDIAFIGNGFEVAGSARLAEVNIGDFVAGIDDFGEGRLRIDARGDEDARRMLALLRQSPLQRDYGQAMATLQAEGPAEADVALRIDLHDHSTAGRQVAGQVRLQGVRLADTSWNLAFSGVDGTVRYNHDGFTADGLRAQYDRQQGRLSLRAGPGHVRDATHGFEAELEASMTTDDLLARTPDLAWLGPYVTGRSRWTTGIAIPSARGRGIETGPSRLVLRSDLVGTAFALPAPMRKPAGQALPTTVELALPLERGEIALAFGQRLALRARQGPTGLGVRAAFGQSQVAEAPPAGGLVLTGRTPTLEAIDWVTLLRGGSSEGSGALAVRRVDVRADALRMLGADFPDTRLQLEPAAAALAVRFDGAVLAGDLQVPDAAGAEITGQLQRLHWRPARAAAAPPAVAEPVATALAAMPPAPPSAAGLAVIPSAVSSVVQSAALPARNESSAPAAGEIDPARVPPLTLEIDDLRVLDAVLGNASFRSRPTAAAMEIQRLQTRAPNRRLDLTGRWTGGAGGGRTALDATFASDDFGALLVELGVGGMIAEGRGNAELRIAWPGSPMQFSLPALQGEVRLDMKDGRLAEVEPGGTGRVLGLLSVAQLPRRLLLDFRDFFSKGFAFNKLGGTVRFGGGAARSDDFDIDGPAAAIAIRGAADLRAQTFDQTIEVRPKAGNLLTAVGAIAGGPVGAAVGAVANAVLQKPIGEITAKNYRVTGPWKEPKVEVVERVDATRPRRREG